MKTIQVPAAKRSPNKAGSEHRHAGFSLVELMIAIALGLVVLVVLTALFVNSSANRREIDKAAGILENGRYALSVLKSELSLAGYYGTLSSPVGSTDTPCSDDIAIWRTSMTVHVHGSNQGDADLNACFTTSPALPARKTGTDAILIQRASTCVAGPTPESGCTARAAGSAYLQVSECGDEYQTTPFVLENGSAAASAFPLKARSSTVCAAAQTAPIRLFYRSIYYVDTANRLIRADRIPGGAFTTPVVLAEGIENLQFEYGFDTTLNGDGTADIFGPAPPSGATWPDAVGVRVWLLARAATATTGYTNTKTFDLGSDPATPATGGVSVTPNDAFKRHVFSSYIGFVNPSGKRFK